jgi:hypothetical protein
VKPKKRKYEVDVDQLKKFMPLTPKEKLEYLEELNKFLNLATPEENKKVWEKLKELGW